MSYPNEIGGFVEVQKDGRIHIKLERPLTISLIPEPIVKLIITRDEFHILFNEAGARRNGPDTNHFYMDQEKLSRYLTEEKIARDATAYIENRER